MKRILDRYVFFEFLKSFLFSLIGLILLVLIARALGTFKIETRQPRIHMYLYLLYSIPDSVAFVLPMAIMFAVCFVVAQFTVSRELVAMLSAGVSFYRIVLPIWIFAAALVPGLFLFQNFIATPANRLASEEEAAFKKDSATIKDIVWQRNLRGREGFYFIYYLDRKEKAIKGGFNYIQMKDGRPLRMMQANAGKYDEASAEWTFTRVREITFKEDISVDKVENLDHKTEKFPEPYDFFENPMRDASELNLFELAQEISRKQRMGFDAAPYSVQFHALLSFPFLCMIVAVIASIAGAGGNHRSTGPLIRALLVSAVTILIYYLGSGLFSNLGNNGVIYPWIASWAPTAGFFCAAIVLVRRNRK